MIADFSLIFSRACLFASAQLHLLKDTSTQNEALNDTCIVILAFKMILYIKSQSQASQEPLFVPIPVNYYLIQNIQVFLFGSGSYGSWLFFGSGSHSHDPCWKKHD